MIQPENAAGVHHAGPGSGVYHPVDFCIPVGPIFNFVKGILYNILIYRIFNVILNIVT